MAMAEPEFEPTPEQADMARVLHDVGTRCMQAENTWAAALANLTTCVRAAREAGIPRGDVVPLVTGGRALGGGTGEQLRKIIRLYCAAAALPLIRAQDGWDDPDRARSITLPDGWKVVD